jgi:AcrR family transcriptional regulator
MSRRKVAAPDGGLEEQRRLQLVAAVVACMSEEGFERTTTRNIADRAGVSIGMLNYYFKNKKELVVEAIKRANEGVLRALTETDSIPFGPRRLEFILRRTVRSEYPEALPLAFRLAVAAAAVNDPDLQVEVCRWMEDGRSKFERSIAAGIDSGTYRSDINPRLLSVILYGTMTGLTFEAAVCPQRVSLDLAVEATLVLLHLFEEKPFKVPAGVRPESAHGIALVDEVESKLLADAALSTANALALSRAFRAMYDSFSNRGGAQAK